MLDPGFFAQDPAVFFQKTGVVEEVIFQPGKGAGVFGRAFAQGAVVLDRGEGVFPIGPDSAKAGFLHQVAREQAAVVGGDQIRAFVLRDGGDEAAPEFGEEGPCPAAIKPVEFGASHQEDAAQHHAGDAFRVGDGIDQGKGRAPAAAETDPAVDLQFLADHLDVGHEVPCGVLDHAGMRARPAAAALIEQDHAVNGGVKIAAHRRAAAATGAAVQNHDGHPLGIAALLDIDAVPIAHVDHALIERVDRRVKKFNCAFLA